MNTRFFYIADILRAEAGVLPAFCVMRTLWGYIRRLRPRVSRLCSAGGNEKSETDADADDCCTALPGYCAKDGVEWTVVNGKAMLISG